MTNRREAFGEKLRRRRELQGASLEAISHNTKISAALFVALEQGTCSRWPAGVYSRSYIRSYADAIGLDAAEVVAEFCECFPELARPETRSPTLVEDRPRAVTSCAPLRLTLGDLPASRRRRASRRVATALCEGLAFAGIAAGIMFVAHVDFWVALASVSLTGHFLVVSSGHQSIVATFRVPASRRHLRSEPQPNEAATSNETEITQPAPTAA